MAWRVQAERFPAPFLPQDGGTYLELANAEDASEALSENLEHLLVHVRIAVMRHKRTVTWGAADVTKVTATRRC